MPTYEFRCPQGHEFEKFYRSISGAEAQAACPQCGEIAERMMSAAGFAFKGSGFYLTDYGKNAHREKGTSDSKSAVSPAEGSKGDAPKSESSGGDAGKSSDASSTSGEKKAAPAPAAESKPASAPKPSKGE
jgi:putative FmdB family regulatory protein